MEVEVISLLFIHSGALEGALREKEKAISKFTKFKLIILIDFKKHGSLIASLHTCWECGDILTAG